VGGSSKGTGTKPEVPDKSIGILSTSHEGTGTKLGDPDKVQEIDWVYSNEEEEKKDDDDDDDKSINIKETDDEETDDKFVRGDEYVQENVDEEMKDAEVDVTRSGDKQMTDTTKADAEKSEEVKDDNKKAELPPSSSSLFVSSDAEINSLLDVQIQQEIPHIQSPSILTVPVSVIPKPLVLSPILEIPTETPVTTHQPPPSATTIIPILQQKSTPIPTPLITTVAPAVTTTPDPLPAIIQRVSVLKKDFQELKEVDHTTTHLASLRSKIPSAINAYLRSSLGDALFKSTIKKALEKTPIILAQTSSQLIFLQASRVHYLKKILRKRDHDGDDKDEDPSAGPNQEESVVEPTEEVIMDASNDDVVNDGKTVDDSQEHTWFNDLLYAKKAPLTLDELMATLIDFSKFEMNRLKIDKLTKPHLFGPIYNLLKGTCQSSNEIEYNMEECYKALSDQLDWNNPERDCCPFDLSKPLPLKGRPGHLTVASEYFFNNDLEYLKSSYPEKKYTTSITKTKTGRYELVGIEDMLPSLWSVTKVGYDKDAERGIKHWGPKHQLLYRSQINKFSKDDVYSTHKILIVVSVKVNKLHGYGHLEEITVRRANRQLYTFKEGDFIDLHLNDIEDILLLAAQHKLFQLDESDLLTWWWLCVCSPEVSSSKEESRMFSLV
ncbi:hypothetical protein Tco_1417099, partial [Tanacetum coccineum]